MNLVTWLRAGSGNTVIGFALGAAPMSLVTGLTIDAGRINASRFEAEAALSAAVWTLAAQQDTDQLLGSQRFLDHVPKGAVFVLRSLDFKRGSDGAVVGTAFIAPPAGLMTFAGLAPEEIVISISAQQPPNHHDSILGSSPIASSTETE